MKPRASKNRQPGSVRCATLRHRQRLSREPNRSPSRVAGDSKRKAAQVCGAGLGRGDLHQLLLVGHLADVLGDLHRTVLGTAHAAEVGALEGVLRQGLVVISLSGLRVERQPKLLLPIELEARLGQRIIPILSPWATAGHIGRVGGDLVGDDSLLDILLVGQPQVLLGSHIAQHGRAVPPGHGRRWRW